MRPAAGFCLPELLIASVLALSLMAGLLVMVDPGSGASKARAAAVDIQQRLRAASEAVGTDVLSAGSGPLNGVFGLPFGSVSPSVLPFRIGPRGDGPGTVRADALTVIASTPLAVAVSLRVAWLSSSNPAEIVPGAGCPVGSVSCGLAAGDVVLLLDGRGQSDLFRVEAVAGTLLTLAPRGPVSGRAFPAGALVVPVGVTTYYLKAGLPADGGQLMAGDGDQVDLPLVDHVIRLRFELFGDPLPPALRPEGPVVRATYGPSPPGLSEDDARDGWPAGENSTVAVSGATQASRLVPLRAGTALVPLAAASLSDGPWCPDASAPWRYDADLLRVRAVRVVIGVEAATAAVRGRDARFFVHPGLSRHRSGAANDQEVVFDVVPRALQAGR